MSAKETRRIVGLHIAKTGGTSTLAHFTAELGREVCWNYGPNHAVTNFFAGRELFEELPDSELARFRFIFGHGVNEQTICLLRDPQVALFCVLRDPYSHFVSSFKHRKRMLARHGQSISPEDFFEQRRANPFANALTGSFPTLAGDPALGLEVRARNVLKHFRFVLQTEHLNKQSKYLCKFAQIPPITRRDRVYRERFEEGDITKEKLYERNEIDWNLYATVDSSSVDDDDIQTSFNSFGFEETATSRLFEKLQAQSDKSELKELARDALLASLRRSDRIEAASVFLRLTGNADSEMARRLMREPTIGEGRSALGAYHLGVVYLRHGDRDLAYRHLSESIQKNPGNAEAHVALAQLLFDQGDLEAAEQHATTAADLNEKQAAAYVLLARIALRTCRYRDAVQFSEMALENAPNQKGIQSIVDAARRHL